jgi:DNA-binding response OmpR family regulator
MGKILLVEDSDHYQKIVVRALGHLQVQCTGTVDEALVLLRNEEFDLILLDISLPKRDGYTLLSEMQSDLNVNPIPIICLTGKTGVTDKVTAFSLGADDYMMKPFDPIELKARVDSKLNKKRREQNKLDLVSVGELEIDNARHRVSLKRNNQKVEILVTQTEFKLLSCLAKKPGQVFTRDQLLVAAWGPDADVLDRAVDVHLCSLRKKLNANAHYIQSVPGVGYRFTLEKTEKNKKAA